MTDQGYSCRVERAGNEYGEDVAVVRIYNNVSDASLRRIRRLTDDRLGLIEKRTIPWVCYHRLFPISRNAEMKRSKEDDKAIAVRW